MPAAPLTIDDLKELWDAALVAGIDITLLNQLRASTSLISGGAVLRYVRTRSSRTLVMVDNVISGAPFVASGLTYDFTPSRVELDGLIGRIGLGSSRLGERMIEAYGHRTRLMQRPAFSRHVNQVVAEPRLMLESAQNEATRRGYRTISLGAEVHGDVEDVVNRWVEILRRETGSDGPVCVVGVGEVSVRVSGPGRGGRCQESAWRMAGELARLDREAVFVARASDGRDFIEGVAGAWVDQSTEAHAEQKGIEWAALAKDHDSNRGLAALGQLLDGGHTGWNLCDIYLTVM